MSKANEQLQAAVDRLKDMRAYVSTADSVSIARVLTADSAPSLDAAVRQLETLRGAIALKGPTLIHPDGPGEASYTGKAIDTVLAALAAARADAERLDEIERRGWHITCALDSYGCWYVQDKNQVCGNIGKRSTLREAIDQARRATR